MSHRKVRAALETKLVAWGTANSVPIVVDNQSSSNTQPVWVSSMLIPAETTNPSVGVQHSRFTGTLRILVRKQDTGKGMGATETLAESIQSYFPRGMQLTSSGLVVWIENTPSIKAGFVDGMYVIVPVDVSYRADAISN